MQKESVGTIVASGVMIPNKNTLPHRWTGVVQMSRTERWQGKGEDIALLCTIHAAFQRKILEVQTRRIEEKSPTRHFRITGENNRDHLSRNRGEEAKEAKEAKEEKAKEATTPRFLHHHTTRVDR